MIVYLKQAGFTLIELLIVIALLAVLATLAVPGYQKMIQNNKIRNAAESIHTGIQIARAEAVKRNTPVQFDLRGSSSAWTVCVAPAAAGNCPSPDGATTIQSRSTGEGSSADVTVTPTTAVRPYKFSVFGILEGGAVDFDVDISTAALSSAESRELRIVVSAGGSVRVCDPALASAGDDPRRCL